MASIVWKLRGGFSRGDEAWWVVELYSEDLDQEAILALRTNHLNASSFGDGDIFRYLRHYELAGDVDQALKWQARLTESKLRDVKALTTRCRAVGDALDDLLPYRGLWGPLQLGTFHRILGLHCDEELSAYLQHIRQVWSRILQPHANPNQLDALTVNQLQLLSPVRSVYDRSTIIGKMSSGELLPSIIDEESRSRILEEILRTDGRIPSLYTFIEDTKYLEPCASVMRTLVAPKLRTSIFTALRMCYSAADRDFQSAYRGLWVFTMRHFARLQPINPRKDAGKPKPAYEISTDLLCSFARLAYESGFRSVQISTLLEGDALDQVVRAFVQTVRPAEQFDSDRTTLTHGIQEFCSVLRSMPQRPDPVTQHSIVSDQKLPLAYRCGRPFERTFLADEKSLYMHNIYRSWPVQLSNSLSTLGVKRDIFCCFFGFGYDERSDPHEDIAPSVATTVGLRLQRTTSSIYSSGTTSVDYSPATRTATSPTIASNPQSACDITEQITTQDMESSIFFYDLDEDEACAVEYEDTTINIREAIRSHQNDGRFVLAIEGGSFVGQPLCEADQSDETHPVYLVGSKNRTDYSLTNGLRLLLTDVYSHSASTILENWPFS